MKQFTLSRFSCIEDLPQPPDVPDPSDGRYQPVLGTVAYDDINKRMSVTTTTGANGKASGRLKSYKFCEGAQQFDVTLPVGDSGNFICMVTHATDPAMTNGIGVGLQSDGAGNWNLATLSGTTVTVGASSGLTDGKTARIEIEKDITGAYWYYIYDAAGTKPTTATGKLFTALSEGYTGWYAKGNSKTYAIDNISIRAESIVGRTNVEVTEPFWFRDEFGEDSRGRYIGIKYDGENNECYTYGRNGIYIPSLPTFIGETIVTIQTRNTGVSTDCHPCVVFGEPKKIYGPDSSDNFLLGNPTLCVRFSTSGVYVYQNGVIVPGATSTAIKYQSGETQTFVVTYNGSNQITVSDGTNSITFTDTAFAVRPVFSAFVGTYSFGGGNGYENRFKLIEISGTRVYNKPIHRGAMLETYHDGTQEVVGTTFIDDCQWDRSAEYTASDTGSATWDVANGRITLTNIKTVKANSPSLGAGYYFFRFSTGSENCALLFYCGSTAFSNVNGRFYPDGTHPASGSFTINNGDRVEIAIISESTTSWTILAYNVTTGQRVTISSLEYGYPSKTGDGTLGINQYTNKVTVHLEYMCCIAVESSSTNGIAACIPPIGGGARYGVQESVYNTFTTENVNKGVYLTTARVKTTNPNADEVSLEYTNETTSTTIDTTPIDVDATYTVRTAPITIDANETDTLRVSVKNSTTCDQSAIYVDSLSLIPVSGDDVLYPQDLAFISGVKPSQKRKVEVK